MKVNAYICEVGQERNANNDWRWVLPYPNPCECTSVIMGGVNTWTPIRPFVPTYVLSPLISHDIKAIRAHYGLECDEVGKFSYNDGNDHMIMIINNTLEGNATVKRMVLKINFLPL